jgi:S1-C subfamily serine protease
MLIATERQRGALLAAACTLAGVGVGFGLSQMAATNGNCQHQVRVEHVRSQTPVQERVAPHSFAAPAVTTYTWLGVEGHTARIHNEHSGLTSGAVVTRVFPGSPAADAGLQAGSLITGVEGTPVVSFPGLIAAIRSHDSGERVRINFVDASGPEGASDAKAEQAVVELGEIAGSQLRELDLTWRRP